VRKTYRIFSFRFSLFTFFFFSIFFFTIYSISLITALSFINQSSTAFLISYSDPTGDEKKANSPFFPLPLVLFTLLPFALHLEWIGIASRYVYEERFPRTYSASLVCIFIIQHLPLPLPHLYTSLMPVSRYSLAHIDYGANLWKCQAVLGNTGS